MLDACTNVLRFESFPGDRGSRRGADGSSESRAEGEGRKLRGAAGAVRDRGGDHSLPDGDDSLRGDRRRSFITRDPVHHCTVPPVLQSPAPPPSTHLSAFRGSN